MLVEAAKSVRLNRLAVDALRSSRLKGVPGSGSMEITDIRRIAGEIRQSRKIAQEIGSFFPLGRAYSEWRPKITLMVAGNVIEGSPITLLLKKPGSAYPIRMIIPGPKPAIYLCSSGEMPEAAADPLSFGNIFIVFDHRKGNNDKDIVSANVAAFIENR
ncbi:MAG: hypothetical protein NT030_00375, partial [Candidatus Saganbacteria bacterium]|nr:hypothetical protein [Candidatus Saganbacteria bacterium]